VNKKIYYQTAFLALAICVYYFTSPSYSHESKHISKDTHIAGVTPARANATPEQVPQQEPAPEPPPPAEIIPPAQYEYVEIVDSCGAAFDGACVNARSKPSATSTSVTKLRNGIVVRVSNKVVADGREWYKISFATEWLRYPERLTSSMYVAAEFTRPFFTAGAANLDSGTPPTNKHITVDLSEQKMYAYDGDELFMESIVSTGIPVTPTPRGNFNIFRKTPSRYMQGPIPGISEHEYDLPGVPWNLYFTAQGAVFHGAYWHDDFGHVHSNGCVNLPLDKAQELYNWAELGTKVLIRD
jgi:hypothetical protein